MGLIHWFSHTERERGAVLKAGRQVGSPAGGVQVRIGVKRGSLHCTALHLIHIMPLNSQGQYEQNEPKWFQGKQTNTLYLGGLVFCTVSEM